MNRGTLPKLARVIALAGVCVVVLAATTVRQVNPPIGSPTAPVRIAIIADHYLSDQEQEFNFDVDNFIKHGLLADGFYKTQAANMYIASYFDETPSGMDSRFGFELGLGDGICAVKAPPNVLTALMDALPAGSVVPTHYVVLGNHDYNVGCTIGQWSYVAVDAAGTDVLQHEFGHLVGHLYDEWAMPSYGAHPGLRRDDLNCAPADDVPDWMFDPRFPGARALSECDHYSFGVVHAYDHCRMGKMHHRTFCLVCQELMKKGFADANTFAMSSYGPELRASHAPTTPAGFRIMNASFVRTAAAQEPKIQPRPVMRVVVDFDPGSSAPDRAPRATFRKQTFSTSVYVPNHLRAGEFLYEISDVKGVKEVGIIPDHMLRSRSFQGGPHETGPIQPVQMFIDVPNEDRNTASDTSRRLTVSFYRIPRSVTDSIITPGSWPKLKDGLKLERIAEIVLPPPK